MTPRRVAALLMKWRAMIENANERGPIPHDEDGHIARWTAVEMCADELEAALADPEELEREKPVGTDPDDAQFEPAICNVCGRQVFWNALAHNVLLDNGCVVIEACHVER